MAVTGIHLQKAYIPSICSGSCLLCPDFRIVVGCFYELFLMSQRRQKFLIIKIKFICQYLTDLNYLILGGLINALHDCSNRNFKQLIVNSDYYISNGLLKLLA